MSHDGAAQPAAPLLFSYSRALAPPLWAFACIMAIELVVVHLLVSALSSRWDEFPPRRSFGELSQTLWLPA